jgi:hypothetical protein
VLEYSKLKTPLRCEEFVKDGRQRRGIILVQYLEYQNVCPFVRIGSPPSPSPPSECVTPWNQRGGGGQHSLAGKRAGVANSDDWRESLAICTFCGRQNR